MSQTRFVHIAKKLSAIWGSFFCWVFRATRICQQWNGKTFVHRSGVNFRPSEFQLDTLPIRHCYTFKNVNLRVLMQVFLLLSAPLFLAFMLLSLLILLLATMHLLVFLLLSALLMLALLLLALLHYECCSMMSLLLLFPAPMMEKSSGPRNETFYIHPCHKSLVPGGRLAWLQGPEFSGIGECKMSHSGDRKTFSGIWECKMSPSRDPKSFLTWGMWKRSMCGGKNVLVSAAGLVNPW